MDDSEDSSDVFADPDFGGQSKFFKDLGHFPSSLFPNLGVPDCSSGSRYDAVGLQPRNGFFGHLDFSFVPPSGRPSSNSSAESFQAENASEAGKEARETFNIWEPSENDPPRPVQSLSWDTFESDLHNEAYSAYITDAGPEVFDAVLVNEIDNLQSRNAEYVVIQSQVYAESLLALGLGRSSVLFSWNEDKETFDQALDNMRISGCTGETVNGLLATFMNCGNKTRALQAFVDKTYKAQKSPGRIALADAVSTFLSALRSHLSVPRASLKSFIQLQAFFRPAERLLMAFHSTIESALLAATDEALISKLFEDIQLLEHRTDSMREIFLEVLARVSRPFLDLAGEWLGLQREAGIQFDRKGAGRGFVKVEDRFWIDEQGLDVQEPDFVLDSTALPSFLPVDDAHTMFETGKSLRFLRAHHPEHPLSRADIISIANPPTLEWAFSWKDIDKIAQKALRYEGDLIESLRQFSAPSGEVKTSTHFAQESDRSETDIFGRSKGEVEAHFSASLSAMSKPLPDFKAADKLSSMSQALLHTEAITVDENGTFAAPLSLTPFLSFGPIIAAQARIVNGTSMRLFFRSHNLRQHLSIQHRFQLMGDGVFSSRLAHSLFDPELETTERQGGVARSGGIMGLRLGGRETWPPASSELRLALMGILTETYLSQESNSPEHAGGYLNPIRELPGGLSFAIREMSEEEIQKCVDPNSVEALDFLRLSYKPPAPLEAIITPLSLYKYDQIFKLLLRATRMLYVVSQLFRDDRNAFCHGTDTTALRFRIEAHHFITCVCTYFFSTGIDTAWRLFDRKLDQVEKLINGDDDYVILGQNEGIDKLREYHERILDRIMFALLLRKRQQAVLALLNEIFGLILQFAKYSRSRAAGVTRNVGQDEEARAMYIRFRRKVEVFITVCKGLSEKKGYGERSFSGAKVTTGGGLFDSEGLAEENTVMQLLAMLEMSNYYSQPVKL